MKYKNGGASSKAAAQNNTSRNPNMGPSQLRAAVAKSGSGSPRNPGGQGHAMNANLKSGGNYRGNC